MTAKEIIATLGRGRMAAALDVTESAVKEAGRKGLFPASWFRVVKTMAEADGVACPEGLFTFKACASDDAAG